VNDCFSGGDSRRRERSMQILITRGAEAWEEYKDCTAFKQNNEVEGYFQSIFMAEKVALNLNTDAIEGMGGED